ncbi:MAG: acyl-CoA thioesterase [Ignavibacteria bacterium]|nr:acyl-CoA thioesterase [Ignavibacteria bacterium]
MDKPVKISQVVMTELVLPNHTNPHSHLLGGQLMLWIDICAALCAAKHAQAVCVTASVDKIDFHHPIKLGEVVTLQASVNRVFNTSLEVGVKIHSESFYSGNRAHTNSAYLTFVSIDKDGNPVPAPKVIPETEEEIRRFEQAGTRREQRLRNRIK